MFIHIKSKHNILADAISRLPILNIYKEPIENPEVLALNDTQQVFAEVHATSVQTIGIDSIHDGQKWDKACKKLDLQIHCSNENSSKPLTLSADGVLQKHQYNHGLQHDITIAPCSLVPTFLHDFYDSKSHQGTIHIFEVIRRSSWRPELWEDNVMYICKCNICFKHLPNMARYQQQHLEIPKVPMPVLAMDTIGHLPITSNSNMWELMGICLHTTYIFVVPVKENLLKHSTGLFV